MHHWKRRNPLRWAGIGILFVVFAAAAAFLFGYVAMSLWNWLMPAIFGLKTISYWQAIGLLVLSWIFFGRFRGHWRRHGPPHWKHRMLERMAGMDLEDMKRYAEEMKDWHTRHHPAE
jgi:positive regulator of sigma E activity